MPIAKPVQDDCRVKLPLKLRLKERRRAGLAVRKQAMLGIQPGTVASQSC